MDLRVNKQYKIVFIFLLKEAFLSYPTQVLSRNKNIGQQGLRDK